MSRAQFYALPEDEVEDWIADWEIERGRCKFHGGPHEECGDDQRVLYPQRSICWPSAQLAVAERLFSMLHEEKPFHDGSFTVFMEKASEMTPFHVGDGLSFYMSERDDDPDDEFLTDKFAKPTDISPNR